MVAVALALSSSLAWGLADFLGGLAARRLALLSVLLGSQLAGLALVVSAVALRGQGPPEPEFALYAGAAGLLGLIGLAAFYRALAVGAMSVVAPITATGAAVPVIAGLASGERPGTLQAAGIALAVIGVVLASREPAPADGGRPPVAAGAGLAVVAALGIGLFLVGIDRASEFDVLWALLVSRGCSSLALVATALALRPPLPGARSDLRAIALVGVLDVSANGLFALALTQGLVSVVGVLGSLYPVVTVFLARTLLGERVGRVQEAGAAAALAGVVLVSAG